MFLTREEEAMLKGEYGAAAQRAMEILVALGKIYEAERMTPIVSAQISGVSYKNLGEAGLEWLEEMARDGRVKVPATMNPAGMDLKQWKEMGVDEEFAEKQMKVINAYLRMGVQPTLTCTPYLAGNRPREGDHVAWSESSAVIFANSVLGARTNREGGPSALAAALTGRTPLYGLHIDENRKPSIKIKAPNLHDALDFALLGFAAGKILRSQIPLFTGIPSANIVQLKALGAALASAGGVPMFHVENITPEARNWRSEKLEKVELGEEELMDAASQLDDGASPDLIFIGCPHVTVEEMVMFLDALKGRRVRKRVWVCGSRAVVDEAARIGVASKLRRLGVMVLSDTCPIVAPIREMGFRSIATNSAKGAWYSRNLNGLKVRVMRLQDLAEEAVRDGD